MTSETKDRLKVALIMIPYGLAFFALLLLLYGCGAKRPIKPPEPTAIEFGDHAEYACPAGWTVVSDGYAYNSRGIPILRNPRCEQSK